MRTLLLTAAALVAAVVVWTWATLPANHLTLQPGADGTIRGVLHVHTIRSDGRGTPDEIAAAAARAGVAFLVFTDHGDGTRAADPPTYRSGVLCLDGAEISTTGGHYAAIGMAPAPYPLGGDPRGVVEDVRRLGGFGIVTHPDSPKAELQWRDWNVPFDAMEWLNPDTSWRKYSLMPGWRPKLTLLDAILQYPIRPAETIGRLLGSPTTLTRWDTLTPARRVVALAGVDAHARLALRNADPGDNRFTLSIPGYEATFRTLSVRVATERPLTRDAARDAAMLIRGLRAGHAYTAVDAFATPASFEFSATNDLGTVHEGDELGASGPVTLRVSSNAPESFATVIYRDGAVLATGNGPALSVRAGAEPAVYRAEIRLPGGGAAPVRWIVSNAIYVRGPGPEAPAPHAAATSSTPLQPGGWRVETNQDDGAANRVDAADEGSVGLRWQLGTAPVGHEFVAFVVDTPGGIAPNDRLTFTIRADRPTRLSVQLRAGEGTDGGDRWGRSAYAGKVEQEKTIFFDELTPIGQTQASQPPLDKIRSLMFVIDTTNAKPSSAGELRVRNLSLAR